MKKKNLVLLGSAAMLSLALAGSIGTAVSASAATISKPGEGTTAETTVNYKVDNQWTIEIPDTITIGGEGENKVKASGVLIEEGATLKVAVSSANEWEVQNGGHGFKYELKSTGGSKANQALVNEDTVLEVAAGTASGEATLTAEIKDEDSTKYSTGGKTYSDQLTFTVTDGTEG